MREITSLETEDFLLIFEQIDFFNSFLAEEKKSLTGSFTHVEVYEVGEYLIQEGSGSERSFYILLSGGASVVKQGARIPLAFLSPGDFFGEVSFLTSRVRTTNVIVHQSTSSDGVQTIPKLFFLGLPVAIQNATAAVLRFDAQLMAQLDANLRIKIKDQIIVHLTLRVESMHDSVVSLTGQDPLLTVDPELEMQLRKGNDLPVDELEQTKDRLIEQLAEFLDELNHCLVA